MTNNRVSGSSYDADGRQTFGDEANFHYDASGAMIKTDRYQYYETLISKSGDGSEAKRSNRVWNTSTINWNAWETSYFIHSSVLGQIVSETTATGKKKFTYVVGAGTVVARQAVDAQSNETVAWHYRDASGLSSRGAIGFKNEELDALGNNVGLHPNLTPPDRPANSPSPSEGFTFDSMNFGDCELDGVMTPCSMAFRLAAGESADIVNIDSLGRYAQLNHIMKGRWVQQLSDDRGEVDLDRNIVTVSAGNSSFIFVPEESSWDVTRQRGPSPEPDPVPQDDDCMRFANLVDAFASRATSVKDFMDRLASTFLGVNEASASELLRAANVSPPRSGDQGIQEKYDDGTGLQVRHFTAGYIAGYLTKLTGVGLVAMGLNEFSLGAIAVGRLESARGAKDVVLNRLSVPLGANSTPTPATRVMDRVGTATVWNVTPANPGYQDLGNQIRKWFCR